MVFRCIVDTCNTTFSSRGRKCKPEGVKLHRFPRPQDRLLAWINNIRAVNGPNWLPPNTENTRICSLHFTRQCYELERQDGVVKLKPNTVPTIFRPPSPVNRATTSGRSRATTDHPYSVAREEADKISRRKVLENIMNSRNPDHLYASPYEPPASKTQRSPIVECGDSTITDVTATFPKPDPKTIEDCEIIELDDESTNSEEEIESPPTTSSAPVLDIPQIQQLKTCIIDDALHIVMPDGSLAQLLTDSPQSKLCLRSSFTDSEVDKMQIKTLSDDNRKLQAELDKVRAFAEKLLRQNERLRQHNRVTARAYRKLKKLVERSNENLSKRLNEDQIRALSKNSTRGQKWSDETVQEALELRAKCGTAVYKAISQRLPYPSVRKLQEAVQTQRFDFENRREDFLDFLAADLPSDIPSEEEAQDTTEESFSINEVIDA